MKVLKRFFAGLYGRFWISLVCGFVAGMAFFCRIIPFLTRKQKDWLIKNIFIDHLGKWVMWGYPWVKVTYSGLEKLSKGPYIFVSNHGSYLDIPLLTRLPEYKMWFAKKELFYIPILGQGMWGMRSIKVDRFRREKGKNYIDMALQRLKDGDSVVIYVEGTRTRTGDLLPFKLGAFRLSLKSGVPLVPCVIKGSYQVNAPSTHVIKPGKIHVKVLNPLFPRDFSSERDFCDRVRKLMQEALSQDE